MYILFFLQTETALMYDAVHLFAKALHDLDSSQRIDIKPLNCDSADTWPHGYSLINYMKVVSLIPPDVQVEYKCWLSLFKVEMRGLTGVIKFDNQGFRSSFVLDIVELGREGLKPIGTWNSTQGVNFTRTFGETYTQIVESLHNKTLVVTLILVKKIYYFLLIPKKKLSKLKTITRYKHILFKTNFQLVSLQSSPYCMRKDSSEQLSGNDQFEGYAIDLIEEISKILGFNYTFKLVPDGRYGSLNRETKEWDGMMRELLEQRADLAIADLTITYDREQAVDFTMPFMNLGE